MNLLKKILHHKQKEVEERKKRWGSKIFEQAVLFPVKDFASALRKSKNLSIIAELKPASPLKGKLRRNFNPEKLALSLEKAGASAISVLTEEKFFEGSLDFLRRVKQICKVPVLRKDFIIDEFQIHESKVNGADAVLLISSILSEKELSLLLRTCKKLGLQCLVEVHSEQDIEKALSAGAEIIGINNRDLKTLRVDLNRSLHLIKLIPPGIITVSESGIKGKKDLLMLKKFGFDAVLIGESLMKHPHPEIALKSFLEVI